MQFVQACDQKLTINSLSGIYQLHLAEGHIK